MAPSGPCPEGCTQQPGHTGPHLPCSSSVWDPAEPVGGSPSCRAARPSSSPGKSPQTQQEHPCERLCVPSREFLSLAQHSHRDCLRTRLIRFSQRSCERAWVRICGAVGTDQEAAGELWRPRPLHWVLLRVTCVLAQEGAGGRGCFCSASTSTRLCERKAGLQVKPAPAAEGFLTPVCWQTLLQEACAPGRWGLVCGAEPVGCLVHWGLLSASLFAHQGSVLG